MFSDSLGRRNLVAQILGVSALIAVSISAGCGTGKGVNGGGGSPSLAAAVAGLGSFSSGEQGAAYTITVSNTGNAATSGTVTVADPPTGFTVTAIGGGATWTCTLATTTCTNSNSLAAGQSFATITVTGNVTSANGTPVTAPLTLSGGGATTVDVTPTPSIAVAAPACPLPLLNNEGLLQGTYVASLNGWEDRVGPYHAAGAFVANGAGGVTNGEMDSGRVVVAAAQSAPKLETVSSGCYQLGQDLRGMMIWNLSGGATPVTFAFSLSSDGQGGHIIEFDDQDPGAGTGTRGAGTFFVETGGPFTLPSFSGPFAYYTKGYAPNAGNTDYLRQGTVGRFDDSASGVVTNGTEDAAFATGTGTQTNVDNQAFAGNFTAPDNLGRGTATFTYPNFNNNGPLTIHFAYYATDVNDLVVQSTDTPDNQGHGLEHGAVNTQINTPYQLGSLSGRALFYMFGADLSMSHSFTVNGAGQIDSDGLGGASVMLDEVSNGSVVATGTNTMSGGSFAVSSNGMGVLTVGSGAGAMSFSIAMYGQNAGVLLEGTAASPGSNVLIGAFELQTPPAGGYNDGTLSGLYAVGTHLNASTNSAFDVGSMMTPTPQTNPASFSGKTDHISGDGCTTGCLFSNQDVLVTYSVDANGRVTITPSGGGGTAVGWIVNKGNRFFFLSDTSDVNGTILSANH